MNNKGLSYIEVLIALAIFGIVLAPVFPALSKAGNDLAAARDGYRARLAAQGILLFAAEAAESGVPPQPSVAAYIAGLDEPIYAYGYWILSFGGLDEKISYLSPGAPDIDADMLTSVLTEAESGVSGAVIVTVVWASEGGVSHRATGFVNR